jgi:hypothetical protein
MTKEALIELITKYVPDGEEIALAGYWLKQDVQDWHGQVLTDEQWDRFVYWFEKYQDSSDEANEALSYALGKN